MRSVVQGSVKVTRALIVWGAAGHAKVLKELVENIGYRIVAVFDNNRDVHRPFDDVPLFHGQEGFDQWRRTFHGKAESLVAIGGNRGSDRLTIQRFLRESGFPPAVAVHPSAFVAADVRLGPGTQVLAHATVCVQAVLGEACIVNTAASIDHECVIGDGVHVAPGAILAGNVIVEERSFIGTGAVILPRVRIGRGATIGAGAVVTKDVRDGATVVGVPARER